MIFDKIENIKNYKGLGNVYKALELVSETDFMSMPLGKYEVDGDNIYYIVQEYETKPDTGIAEAHKKYIDVQFVADGEEKIGYAPICVQKELTESKEDSDCYFYRCNTEMMYFGKGYFAVFYPNDLHKPGILNDKSSLCRKVVVKVKAE